MSTILTDDERPKLPEPDVREGTMISLCDITGHMVQPWVDAGYRAVLVDPQHGTTRNDGRVERIADTVLGAACRLGEIIRDERVVFVAGFPPCTDVAVSGSRWFATKAVADPHFQAKAALVAEQCRTIGLMAGSPWFFENPVSVFSSIFGPPGATFHPWEFTGFDLNDNYTKKTCLWSGGFIMPPRNVHPKVQRAVDVVIAEFGRMVPKRKALDHFTGDQLVANFYPDNRIHDAPPGEGRADFRSATPRGFAHAVFLANAPHLKPPAQEKSNG